MAKDVSQPPIVYIAGMGRSGTTLVEGLMADRCGFFAVGEMVYLWVRGVQKNERCSCGAHFRDCPFWMAVLNDAFGSTWQEFARSLVDVDVHRHFLAARRDPSQDADELERFLEAQRRIYASVAKVSGAAVIIDSSKFPRYGTALLGRDAMDLRVLHVVRDSRAVAHSWQRRKERPESTDDGAVMPTFKAPTVSRDWLLVNRRSDELRRAGTRGELLRYEDLADETKDVLGDCVNALGVGGIAASEAPFGHRHSVSGNPARLDRTPTRVTIDDAWVSEMPPRTKVAVTAMTAPWLVRYGYPLRRK